MQLVKRSVAILGGSAGIGLATATLLAERGAEVIIGGRDERRLADAASSLPGSARTIAVDATDSSSLRGFFSQAGLLDDLVVTVTSRTNSGGGPARTLADQDLAAAFAGKLIPHLRAVALSLPSLAERGSITLVSGGTAQSALPGTAGPAAVNGAVEAAIPPLARELAPRRINAVSPGIIETGWWDAIPEPERQAMFEQFAQQTPLGRNGTPQDVAAAIVALLANEHITGVVLPCDGGLRFT